MVGFYTTKVSIGLLILSLISQGSYSCDPGLNEQKPMPRPSGIREVGLFAPSEIYLYNQSYLSTMRPQEAVRTVVTFARCAYSILFHDSARDSSFCNSFGNYNKSHEDDCLENLVFQLYLNALDDASIELAQTLSKNLVDTYRSHGEISMEVLGNTLSFVKKELYNGSQAIRKKMPSANQDGYIITSEDRDSTLMWNFLRVTDGTALRETNGTKECTAEQRATGSVQYVLATRHELWGHKIPKDHQSKSKLYDRLFKQAIYQVFPSEMQSEMLQRYENTRSLTMDELEIILTDAKKDILQYEPLDL